MNTQYPTTAIYDVINSVKARLSNPYRPVSTGEFNDGDVEMGELGRSPRATNAVSEEEVPAKTFDGRLVEEANVWNSSPKLAIALGVVSEFFASILRLYLTSGVYDVFRSIGMSLLVQALKSTYVFAVLSLLSVAYLKAFKYSRNPVYPVLVAALSISVATVFVYTFVPTNY